MPDSVLLDLHQHTLIITINRPEARNAVNLQVTRAIAAALERADSDDSIWVIIITGAGPAAFCAGADLKAIAQGDAITEPSIEHWKFAGWVNHYVSKPTIAAVNGIALGGGTEIVLASDLAVAAESAQFGLPEVKRGLIANGGGAFRVSQHIPQKLGMQMLLTGGTIDAGTALRFGLVNEVVPDGTALARARELADQICENSPLAVQASKRLAHGMSDPSRRAAEATAWNVLAEESAAVRASADGREGPRAFAEKRKPVWTGR